MRLTVTICRLSPLEHHVEPDFLFSDSDPLFKNCKKDFKMNLSSKRQKDNKVEAYNRSDGSEQSSIKETVI